MATLLFAQQPLACARGSEQSRDRQGAGAQLHTTVCLVGLVCASALLAQAPAPAPAYQSLKYPPLRQVKIPDVAAFTLKNGMRLYLLENHELPLVGGFALVRTGNLFDPPDKVGLAEITGSVMRTGGTKTKTGDEIDVELENRAASVEAGIGESSGSVSFSALQENTDQVLAIFKDVLVSPEFRQDKLDLIKTQLRGVISRRNDDAGDIASREFSGLLYGRNTPYGWRMEYVHLDNIQREDLVAFHRRYFFPANIMLAVQGDFNTAQMQARLEILFGEWDSAEAPVPRFPEVTARPEPGVWLAAKSDVTQTFFRLGHLGGVLKDKDYPALEVMADILGGSFSSRLFKKVRTGLGLAYEIGAAWGANYEHPGLFEVSGSTKSSSTVDAVKAIQAEIETIRAAEVTGQELRTAQDTVLNSFVFRFDHPAKTLNRLVTYEYHGYPKDFLFQYQKAIEAVTTADVLRVAREYLRPGSFTLVAAGNPQDFGTPLTALGEVKNIDLTIPEPKKEAAQAGAASLEKGRALLQKAQQALGGAGQLAAVKDMTQVAEVALNMGGGSMKATQKNQWLSPSGFRQEQQLPFGKIVAYSDGQTGWLQTPQGQMPMAAPVIKQVQGELFRNWFTLLASDRDAGRTVNYLGDGTLEISDRQGNSVRLKVDEASGLPQKMMYETVAMAGAPQAVEESYEDWKETGGIRLPYKFTITQGGKKVAEGTVQSLEINTGLKAEELGKKP
jgi:zinc protease